MTIASPRSPNRRGRRLTVALVGADGAGKSTISRRLAVTPMPAPVKTIYMGVNLEASSLMLPTTRLLLAAKRARGGRPDLVASRLSDPADDDQPRARHRIKDAVRLTVWMLEEWLRQGVASVYGMRGYIVVFDRHFFADYYHADVAQRVSRRSGLGRLHGWTLQHLYPKPDLVICLDAPADVLYARKPEASPEWLDHRRHQYLNLDDVVDSFVVIDADRQLDDVLDDVVACINDRWRARCA